ncbi:MAG: hypothetical protein CVV39_01275 [Planctomycetes bacterium HGW-Planctomycetes-1]|nr:MAG: hypothetical protein CVV39_01275 [Planctomycetes bacterium HGW-Planctomycetes-1]
MLFFIKKFCFIFFCSLVFCPAISAAETIYKFDFGPDKSPVFEGFTAVSEETVYSRQTGFGWDYGSEGRQGFDRERYDNLCRDLVYVKSSSFKADIADGKYIVNLWIGDLYDLADYLRFGIKAERRVILRAGKIDFKTYSDFYFQSSNRYYSRKDNPWDLYIDSRFIRRQFNVMVNDGQLNIDFENCRLSAMVIYPARLAGEAEKEISIINTNRRKQFETSWSEIKPRIEASDLNLEPADSNHGYVVFKKGWMEKVYPQTVPQNREICRQLNVSCAKGEYEPVSFSIYPLVDLKNVRIMVEHLFNEAGEKFETQNVDVRLQKYRIARLNSGKNYQVLPSEIANFYEVDIERGVTRKFILDIYVPKDTKEGVYEGNIWIRPENRPTIKIRLTLRVLPFELLWDRERHNYALQYFMARHYWDFRDEASYKDYLKCDFVFMKRFGITVPTLGYDPFSWPVFSYDSGRGRLASVDLSAIAGVMDVYKKVGGFTSPYIIYCTYGLTLHGNYKLPLRRNSVGWAYLEQENEFWAAYKEIVRQIKQKQVKNDWPEFIFLAAAEMSNGGLEHIKYGKEVLDNLRENPGVKVAAMTLSEKELQMLTEVSNIVGVQISICKDDNVRYAREKSIDKSYWIYQANNRFAYGYYFYKTSAKGTFKEDYQHVFGDPYNGFDDAGDELLAFTRYTLPTADGPVPLMECYEWREGIDDARYLYTLAEHIKRAKGHADADSQQKAQQGQELLDKISAKVNPDLTYYRDVVGFWDNAAYDKLRSMIAEKICELSL